MFTGQCLISALGCIGSEVANRVADPLQSERELNELAVECQAPPAAGLESLPIFLLLRGRRVLVVGGGLVAASKVTTLLAVGAAVTLVAPTIIPEADCPGVTTWKRQFREQDLNGVWLVVAAAPAAVNAKVARAAARRRLFVNAVDDPRHASAMFGGVIRRGDITLAISSGGSTPDSFACYAKRWTICYLRICRPGSS